MSKAQPKPPTPAAASETGKGPNFLIAGALVAVVLGGLALGWQMRRSAAPTSPSATTAVSAPVNVPAPVMSQAAPADEPQVHGNATSIPAANFSGGARLATDYSRLDFGAKGYKEMVDGAFTVSNVGDAPLTIEDVSVRTIMGC